MDGHRRSRLLPDGTEPVWGRGGVAFTRTVYNGKNLVLVNPRGRKQHLLVHSAVAPLFAVGWSHDGRILLAAQEAYPGLHALLIRPVARSVTTVSPLLSAIEGISRDGRRILAEANGNVVVCDQSGAVTILARDATAPSWTR